MRTASAFDIDDVVPAPTTRPRLTLVPPPTRAGARPTPPRQRLAALLAGLSTGFVLAALATALGGGNPAGRLVVALGCATLLAGVLVRARVVTVRAQRRRRAAARRASAAHVVATDPPRTVPDARRRVARAA